MGQSLRDLSPADRSVALPISTIGDHLGPGMEIIAKPFAMEALAAKIQEITSKNM